MDSPFRYAANCSLLFREFPLLERPAAAAAEGFEAIELWWPWPDRPVPSDREVDALVAAVEDSGVSLVGLNFFAGDLFGPDCGVLSIPDRVGEFRDNVDVAVGIGERLGVPAFNALYGNRFDGTAPEKQDELAVESLAIAAKAAARIGATVLVEPVSGPKPYPLRTADDVAAVLARAHGAGAANVAMLCDLFHLANNGDDVATAIDRHADSIAHVQVADHPGRGEPGSGDLDLSSLLARLDRAGYDGWVALEYNPTTTTTESLAWLPRDRRGAGTASRPQGD
jgi:hydroxypyruvate isomerase